VGPHAREPVALNRGEHAGRHGAGVAQVRWTGLGSIASASAFGWAKRHDPNAAIGVGSDAERSLPDLLTDDLLDFGQVGLGFEVSPIDVVTRVCHRSVSSMN
jgi:hypothetical protein